VTAFAPRADAVYFLRRDLGALCEGTWISPRSILLRISVTQRLGRAAVYIETICLSLTAFLLMVPSVAETLRRVPDGHPLVTDLNSPLLVGAQASLLITLIIGVTAQVIYLRKHARH
jgi:hypothetical protein